MVASGWGLFSYCEIDILSGSLLFWRKAASVGGCWLVDFLQVCTSKRKALAASAGGKDPALPGKELLDWFLGLGCSSSCGRTVACGSLGCHHPSRLVEPCPRHLLSSAESCWVACLGVFHPECFLAVSHFLVPLGSFEVDFLQLVIAELSWGWPPRTGRAVQGPRCDRLSPAGCRRCRMTLFDGVYPFYLQQRKVYVFDVNTIIVIVVFLTFACTFLLIIPGIRGRAVRDPSHWR